MIRYLEIKRRKIITYLSNPAAGARAKWIANINMLLSFILVGLSGNIYGFSATIKCFTIGARQAA